MIDYGSVFEKHTRVALQLSGGKDSVACLYLLRPYLDRLTVYHLNAGDRPPETVAVIEACKKIIPHFVEVHSDVRGWIAQNGYPSDVVPTNSSPLGRKIGFGVLPLSDRFSCCYSNIMLPMHRRMQEDGITLIIRGQKLADMPSVPFKSGDVVDGVEFLYPIENWSDKEVFSFLRTMGAPINPAYQKLNDGIECQHCTAWWNHRHLDWLESAHPDAAKWVARKHIEIKMAVSDQIGCLR